MEASEGQHSLREYGSEDNKPPKLSFKLKKTGDIVTSSVKWRDVHLPVDILLLTVERCDFLSCFSLLDQPFRSYNSDLGYVYFGRIGEASDKAKLWVALMTSSEGAATPRGSLAVGQIAFRVLRPKAVFSVGTCISLDSEKVRRGDVVISSKLTTAEGFKVPDSTRFVGLAKDAPYGWLPPLENPGELEVNVHPNGDILSLSLTEKRQYDDICKEYPGAVAIETEGKGVYAAAYDTNIEWVIVKGVASYFYQSQSATFEWMSFASSMAASVVAKMLIDPTVVQKWRHYNQEMDDALEKGRVYTTSKRPLKSMGEYQKAIEYHKNRLKIAIEIGDRAGEGRAYGNLGIAYWSLGDYRKSIQYHEKDLKIAIESGDRGGEGQAYGNLANSYQSLGNYEKSIKYHEKRLKIAVETGDRGGEGKAYGNLGIAFRSLGDYEKSIENHEKDLKIAIEIGNRGGEGQAYGNLGNSYQSLGDYQKSIEYHEKDLQIAIETGDRGGEGRACGNLGIAYRSLGDYRKSIEYHEKLLKIALETGDQVGEGGAYGNLGVAYQLLGDYQKSIEYLEKHLKIAKEIGDRNGERRAYRNLGNSYGSLCDYRKSIEYHEKDLQIAREIGDRRGEGGASGNLGIAYWSLESRGKRPLYPEVTTAPKRQRQNTDIPETSDVKEGKGDEKATDKEGKHYDGPEGEDDGGGAEADKVETQEEEHYEHDTYDDDKSGQISEVIKKDFSHAMQELQKEEDQDKVAIFEGTVTSEGIHIDIYLEGIHLTFPPNTVAEPTRIMVYRWNYGARLRLPHLMEPEAIVGNVIEISAATEVGALEFNGEVKLVLSHCAADLEGYERVMKRLVDTEKNVWEEIPRCEDIRKVSDIEDDYPCPNNVPYLFPVVRAGITKCSTYAVVSRLKLSPTYTITVSGGTFAHPDYPQVSIIVPQEAVATETRLSLQLQVQEVPQEKIQGRNLFAGPILRVLCTSRATFLKPVTIKLPVSLGNKLVNIPQPSVCRVRVFFLNSERETKEWIEISDELENPANYDGKLVTFKVQRFSGALVLAISCSLFAALFTEAKM